jgi:hypothetical protein
MRRAQAAAIATIAAGALVGAATQPADADTGGAGRHHHAKVAPGNSGTIRLPLKPGRHRVSIKVPEPTPTKGRIGPLTERSVSPRVTCGGFNGNVEWGGNGSVLDEAYLDVWGTLWSTCKTTTYLYISYQLLQNSYNKTIKSAGANSSVGVNWSTSSDWATFGYIVVDTCSTYKGWTCGAPVHV